VPPLRVLVAFDFSPESRAALRTARDLIKSAGGDLTIAHVRAVSDVRAAVIAERGDLLNGPSSKLARAMADHYRTALGRAVRGPHESSRLLRGDPAQELRREAARGYDFLVMGTHGRGRTGTFLLGSTVQKVLVNTSVPIIVVPARRAARRRAGS
jgi:nucleotide-binding universal stress UspA family protein